ncbi:MAG: M15 family metallopeptidase [Bacteroidota bacterium]|nr:M15 family metallopeptidase [Bacteroidota bacterium]
MNRRSFNKTLVLSTIYGLNAYSSIFKTKDEILIEEILGLDQCSILCGDGYMLREEVNEAYLDMQNDALKDGVKMWCTSGYRSFYYQKGIWNNKFLTFKKNLPNSTDLTIVKKIVEYSAIPGTSRHHWGTDLDITDAYGYYHPDPLNDENYEIGGEYQYLNAWLQKNAHKFHFYQTYTKDTERTGYKYEPWHYSYAPIAKIILKQLLEIDLLDIPEIKKIKGYSAINQSFMNAFKKKYLLGINELLL